METSKKNNSRELLVAICAIALIIALLYCASKCCSSMTCCGVFCALMSIFCLSLILVILYFVFSYYRHRHDQMIEIAKLAIQNAVKKEEREHDKEMFKWRFVQRMLEDYTKNQHELELKAKEKEIIHYRLGQKFIEDAYHYIAKEGASKDNNISGNKADELAKANEVLKFIIKDGIPTLEVSQEEVSQKEVSQKEKPQGDGCVVNTPPINPTTK